MLPAALIGLIGPVVNKILDRIPDAKAREAARMEMERELRRSEEKMLELMVAADKAQADINAIEAANTNIFVSGWRPLVGWVCGFGFAWATVVQPIAVFLLAAFHHSMATPEIQSEVLIQALFGLLGMGALRTYEKKVGVASK